MELIGEQANVGQHYKHYLQLLNEETSDRSTRRSIIARDAVTIVAVDGRRRGRGGQKNSE
jgi:hypothetical protein